MSTIYPHFYAAANTQNDVEAIRWYRKAAEQGNAPAQYGLRNLSTTLRHWRLRFTEQSLLLWMWMWQVG